MNRAHVWQQYQVEEHDAYRDFIRRAYQTASSMPDGLGDEKWTGLEKAKQRWEGALEQLEQLKRTEVQSFINGVDGKRNAWHTKVDIAMETTRLAYEEWKSGEANAKNFQKTKIDTYNTLLDPPHNILSLHTSYSTLI